MTFRQLRHHPHAQAGSSVGLGGVKRLEDARKMARSRSSASSRSAVARLRRCSSSRVASSARCRVRRRMVQPSRMETVRNTVNRISSLALPTEKRSCALVKNASTKTASTAAQTTPPGMPRNQALRTTVGKASNKGKARSGTKEYVSATAKPAATHPRAARAGHGKRSIALALNHFVDFISSMKARASISACARERSPKATLG